MTRTLRRPMFRMGGNTDQGIMSGVVPRQGYDNGELVRKAQEDKALMQKLVGQRPDRSLSDFMIDFGLNVAGATPSGSIFSTAAKAAQEPFQRFQTAKAQRGAFDQQIGLSAAQSAIAHRDKMKEMAAKYGMGGEDARKFNFQVEQYMRIYKVDRETAEKAVSDRQFYSKEGFRRPEVERNKEIEDRAMRWALEDDDNAVKYDYFVPISEAIQDAIDGKLDTPGASPDDEISGRLDRAQMFIDEDDITQGPGDTLTLDPKTEKGEKSEYTSGDYEINKIYYNPQDGNWYIFDGDKAFTRVQPYIAQEG